MDKACPIPLTQAQIIYVCDQIYKAFLESDLDDMAPINLAMSVVKECGAVNDNKASSG